jgi:hypothetical protein
MARLARTLRRRLALAALLFGGLFVRPSSGSGTFTLAIIPDVQQETSDTRLADRLRWLVSNRAALNLAMVLQCGDLMNFPAGRLRAHDHRRPVGATRALNQARAVVGNR